MAMDFRVFAPKIVHARLAEAGLVDDGYPSLRTVARWASSGQAPAWVDQAMREILSLQKEGPPDWSEGLRADIAVIRRLAELIEKELPALRAISESSASPEPLAPDDRPGDQSPPRTRRKHDR